jgi:N-formylmaleamate deformylase
MVWTAGQMETGGASLHYYRTGGERPALLLLHGITDSALCWTRVARVLERDFDVVMPDARGHGLSRSAGPDVTVWGLARDAAAVVEALAVGPTLVFGHSMGAITAAALAAERPDLVRALVLEDPPIEPGFHFDPDFVKGWQADLAIWATLSPQERHARAAAENPGWDPSETDPLGDAKAAVDPAVLDFTGSAAAVDWSSVFSRIRCPGLLVTGDRSMGAIVSPQTAAATIRAWPAGRVAHVAGAGHCIHRDRWDEAMAPIRAFLLAEGGVPR